MPRQHDPLDEAETTAQQLREAARGGHYHYTPAARRLVDAHRTLEQQVSERNAAERANDAPRAEAAQQVINATLGEFLDAHRAYREEQRRDTRAYNALRIKTVTGHGATAEQAGAAADQKLLDWQIAQDPRLEGHPTIQIQPATVDHTNTQRQATVTIAIPYRAR